MTRKPDRFERMVNNGAVTPGGHSIYITDAIALLRREHQAVARAMKKLTRYDENVDYSENQRYLATFKDGAYVRLDDVLTALAKRAR